MVFSWSWSATLHLQLMLHHAKMSNKLETLYVTRVPERSLDRPRVSRANYAPPMTLHVP